MNIIDRLPYDNNQSIFLEIASCTALITLGSLSPSSLFKYHYTSEILSSFNEHIGIDPRRVDLGNDIFYNISLIALQSLGKALNLNIEPLLCILSSPAIKQKIIESEALSKIKGTVKTTIIKKINKAKFSILKSILIGSLKSYLMKTKLNPLIKEININSPPTVILDQIKDLLSSRYTTLDHQSRLVLTEAQSFLGGCIKDIQELQNHISTQQFSLEDISALTTKVTDKISDLEQFKLDVSKIASFKISNKSDYGIITKLIGTIALKKLAPHLGIIDAISNNFSGLECLTRSTGSLVSLVYPEKALLTSLSTEALVYTFFNKSVNEFDRQIGSSIRRLLSQVRSGFELNMRSNGYNELEIAKAELLFFETTISALTLLSTFGNAPAINCLTHLQLIQTLESHSSLAKPSQKLDCIKSMIIQGVLAISLTLIDSSVNHNPLTRIGLNIIGLTLNNPIILKSILKNKEIKKIIDRIDPTEPSKGIYLTDKISDKFLSKNKADILKSTTRIASCTYKLANKLGITIEKCSKIANQAISFYSTYSLGSIIESISPSLGFAAYFVEPNKSITCKAIKSVTCLAVSSLTGSFLSGSIAATTTENLLSLS